MPKHTTGHVTLSDIAAACELSVSTVSIVLSEAKRSCFVAESTRKRVRAAAERLGYHPDLYARSLRSRHSKTIGVLAYDTADPFCIPVTRGIEQGLQQASYFSLLVNAQTRRDLFDQYLRMILERRAEGVIVIASWVFEETNLLADIEKNHIPIVIVGRDMTAQRVPSILVDNRAGGAMLVEHLAAQGHKKIAVIRGPQEMFDSAPRWQGIESTARRIGIHLDPALTFTLPSLSDSLSSFDGGRYVAKQLLATGQKFSAVLAFDDLTALGVVRGLTEAGLRVPEDCSVAGFDDILPAHVATPGITTIRQPLEQMGMLATERILAALSQKNKTAKKSTELYVLEPELVLRASTACVSRATRSKGVKAINP